MAEVTLKGLLGEFRNYLRDASPGGLLNPEITPERAKNALEYVSMTPTPFGDAASGLLAGNYLMKGQFGNAGLEAVGLLPFVPGMTKVFKKLPYQIEHMPMRKSGGASTLDDLTTSFGEEVYGNNALRYFGEGSKEERNVLNIMKRYRGKPDELVTIYRGVPSNIDNINPGDWVTLDKNVAQLYADPNAYGESLGKVIEMKVPAKHVTSWPDSLLEFGYFPE